MTSDLGGFEDKAGQRVAAAGKWAASQPWDLTPEQVRRTPRSPFRSIRTAVALGIASLGVLFGSLIGAGVFSSPGLSLYQRHSLDGRVVGRLVVIGKRVPNTPMGVPGRVVLTPMEGGQPQTTRTSTDGSFSVSLPAGTYAVTGYSPKVTVNGKKQHCEASRTVTVKVRGVVRGVSVICTTSQGAGTSP
jgi:hypothetical protein